MNTTQTANSKVEVGDLVFSVPHEDYGCLVGKVTKITPFGSPEHDTGNKTDDVHVDFFAPYSLQYSENRKNEIAQEFSELYGKSITYDDLTLDDVIMPPKNIVKFIEVDVWARQKVLSSREQAKAYYDSYLSENNNKLKGKLRERIEKNFTEYHNSLMGFSQRELIDMAGKIKAMSDAHSYMTMYHHFNADELDFYLQFKNPLEVVADNWYDRNSDLDDMSFTMDNINEHRDLLLEDYPQMNDADVPKDESLHRYMGVDLELYLGTIAEKVIVHYPNDWNYDKETLFNVADIDNFGIRRLIWHVCSYGTHLKSERDVFVRDSGAYEYMTDYRQNDSDMFGYVIEVTGRNGNTVIGNIFEVGNYANYARYIRDTALPLDSVTLKYSDEWGVNAGKTITVSRREYDDDRNRLMCKSGNVTALRFNPADESDLTELLRQERSKRMSLPIGSTGELLRKMADKLAEVRKYSEQPISEQHEKSSLLKQLQEKSNEVKTQPTTVSKKDNERS